MPSANDDSLTGFEHLVEHKPGATVQFYEAEGRVLELWDELQELQLRRALFEAAQSNANAGTLRHLESMDEADAP